MIVGYYTADEAVVLPLDDMADYLKTTPDMIRRALNGKAEFPGTLVKLPNDSPLSYPVHWRPYFGRR